MAAYEWPWQYNFPPFFTLQPNLDTRGKQLEGWRNVILGFCKFQKQYRLDITEAQNSQLFYNSEINRKLPLEAIYIVLDNLSQTGNVEWIDKQKQRCFVFWRKPDEWAELIYNWASNHGMTNTVCTLFELTSGDDTIEEEFHGLDEEMLRKAIKVLEDNGKAKLISLDGSEGVKFI